MNNIKTLTGPPILQILAHLLISVGFNEPGWAPSSEVRFAAQIVQILHETKTIINDLGLKRTIARISKSGHGWIVSLHRVEYLHSYTPILWDGSPPVYNLDGSK